MSRKQPNPPPAGVVKTDPPPAPPRRRAPWPAPPMPWPKAPLPPERDHGTRFDVYAPHPDGGELSPPQGGTGTRYPGVQSPKPWPESLAAGVVTKRIDRGDGASEVSFYAIGPKRGRQSKALADLERFAEPGQPWTYCADALPKEAGRYEVSILGSVGPFATRGHYNVGERGSSWSWSWPQHAGYVYAWRPEPRPAEFRPADCSYLLDNGVPPEWLGAEKD